MNNLHDVQKGHPARPQGKPALKAYTLGDVEDAGEPRTKLGAFFNTVPIGEDDDR
jgi:hypothetical protein